MKIVARHPRWEYAVCYWPKDRYSIADWLNAKGKEGWELCQFVTLLPSGDYQVVFKRSVLTALQEEAT